MTSSALPAPDIPGRMARLRQRLPETGADALLVTSLTNVRYLTGFTGSSGVLLVCDDTAMLVTDGRYRTQAAEQLAAAGIHASVDLVIGGAQSQRDALSGAVGRQGPRRLGLEADSVTWAAQRRWADVLAPVELVATSGVVEALRVVKDSGELARMARAAAIADDALGEIVPMLDAGPSEAAVALALDTAMRRLGAEDRAFETIVASGPNAAMPHARARARGCSVRATPS